MRSSTGISSLHGSHHVAQKSTRRTFPSAAAAISTSFPSRSGATSAMRLPTSAEPRAPGRAPAHAIDAATRSTTNRSDGWNMRLHAALRPRGETTRVRQEMPRSLTAIKGPPGALCHGPARSGDRPFGSFVESVWRADDAVHDESRARAPREDTSDEDPPTIRPLRRSRRLREHGARGHHPGELDDLAHRSTGLP